MKQKSTLARHTSHYPLQIAHHPIGRTELEDQALKFYQKRNQSFEKCAVYHLTRNGFFAEYHDLVMVMIWAWQKGYQFVLDSSRFLYSPNKGWSEYFEPFCRSADEVDSEQVIKGFEFNPKGRPTFNTQILRSHRPDSVCIGEVKMEGYDCIVDFFKRMIFRLNTRCNSEVTAQINSIDLPPNYLAVQIRRGDKIGEDIYYPADLYLSRLGYISDQDTLFVMTDDYRTIGDVQACLDVRGLATRVITLCEKQEQGFNICHMREGKTFTKGLKEHTDAMEENSPVQHTDRLLAEMLITSGARRLVTTRISFLGIALRAFRGRPEYVSMLEPEIVSSFTPPKLPAGRHILDAYKKVLLIQPGPDNTRFFSCVLSAMNQIIYCARRGYLPVIDFNAKNCSPFYEPDRGDDIWSYYFEPVAGYTVNDILTLRRDPQDRLNTEDVVKLNNEQITDICQFDIHSIFHYPLGYWHVNPPEDIYQWYKMIRLRGHLITSRHIAVRSSLQSEVRAFEAEHMTGWRVLGVHITNTGVSGAPYVPPSMITQEIDRRLETPGYDRIFLTTDQASIATLLGRIYGDKLIVRDYPRLGDGDTPSDLQRPPPGARAGDALLDALLFSRCTGFLHGPTVLTEFAHYLSPDEWPPLPIFNPNIS